MNILRRARHTINTDPLRRCYNGCNFREEQVWGPWEVLEFSISADTADRRLTFWRELNDYAVSQRGEGARCEFKVEP